MLRRLVPLALVVATLAPGGARAQAPSCGAGTVPYVTGTASAAVCASDALGGETPFSYYVPEGCAPTRRCPVLYLLHGFGGTSQSMLRPAGTPTAWQRALTHDPIGGGDLPDLDFIVVAPHGRTVETARAGAPPAGVESFWVDWNPRYWEHPPRFEAFVAEELIGLVDRSFPTIPTREGRAIDGVSLGGFGAFKLALQHPDRYASAGSISGALNILVAPNAQPLGPGDPGILVETPFVRPPRVAHTPPGFPFGDPFGAFGDPVADEAYFRGNNPLDLAINARGLPLNFFHNDMIPRDPMDLGNPPSYAGAQGLEAAVFPMNTEMREALLQTGNSDFEYALHPGLHSGKYWDPYVRARLEWHWARVSHPDEPPLSPAVPSSFDHRSIRTGFSVWGWDVTVEDRDAEQFVTLWNASRNGVTVTGSGNVTITTPAFDPSGVELGFPALRAVVLGVHAEGAFLPDGRFRVTLEMGPDGPTDEHAGSTGVPGGSNWAKVCLSYGGDPPTCRPEGLLDN